MSDIEKAAKSIEEKIEQFIGDDDIAIGEHAERVVRGRPEVRMSLAFTVPELRVIEWALFDYRTRNDNR